MRVEQPAPFTAAATPNHDHPSTLCGLGSLLTCSTGRRQRLPCSKNKVKGRQGTAGRGERHAEGHCALLAAGVGHANDTSQLAIGLTSVRESKDGRNAGQADNGRVCVAPMSWEHALGAAPVQRRGSGAVGGVWRVYEGARCKRILLGFIHVAPPRLSWPHNLSCPLDQRAPSCLACTPGCLCSKPLAAQACVPPAAGSAFPAHATLPGASALVAFASSDAFCLASE